MVTFLMRPIALIGLLSACAADETVSRTVSPPPTTPALLLHTTLDGPASVAAPLSGNGTGAIVTTTPINDFVTARFGSGLRADAVAERVLFPQAAGGVQNLELERGTLEFWYRPNYNPNDDVKVTIAGTGAWHGNGVVHLGKHNSTNNYALFLIFYDANSVRWEHNVAVTNYHWKAGDWVLIRLTWDFSVAPNVQNLHLYLNGAELPLTNEVSRGTQPVPAERSDVMMYIGSRDTAGQMGANGLYDEVKIWNAAIPPN